MDKQIWTLRGLNFSYYATTAVLMPFLPIYFEGRGYSSSQIGLMMIGPFVTLFAQPLWGYLSDRYQTLKPIIFGLWSMTVLSSVGIFQTAGYSFALLFMLLLYFFMLSSVPLLDTMTIKSAAKAQVNYGTVRMFGSLGFTMLATTAGPLLQALGGLEHIPYLYWSIWILPLGLLLLMKDDKGAAGPRVRLSAFGKLLGNKRFLWFLLLVFILTVPHRMNDVLLGLYLKDLGASDTMVGLAWALAAASEVPTFALLGKYFHKFNELALLGVIGLIYTIRWLLYGYIADPLVLLLLQASHCITFAAFWVTAVQYAVRLVPMELQSTGQSMLSMVFLGLAGITGGLAGGWVKDEMGGAAMYGFGAGLAFAAAVLLLGTHAYYRNKKPSAAA